MFCLSLVSLSPSALPWGCVIESKFSSKNENFEILMQSHWREVYLHISLRPCLTWSHTILGAVLAVSLAFTITKLSVQSLTLGVKCDKIVKN